MASDLAAIRAEGRRLLADFYAFGTEDDGFRRDRLIDFFYDHADALLADPAPSVPLVEAGAALPKWLGRSSPEGLVTLPKLGQRVRITTDGGMDHVGEVIRYGDPEGNVRTLFMVALDDGSSGYFLDEPSWHWTLVPHRPEDTKGGDDEAALARDAATVRFARRALGFDEGER